MKLGGLGDWFEPDCVPGTPNCVPHWYCYIPGAATPDCLASLQQGINTIAGAVGTTAGGAVNSAVTGAVQGATGAESDTSSMIGNFLTPVLIIGAGLLALYVLVPKR